MKPSLNDPNAVHDDAELRAMLQRMRAASSRFYGEACAIGCHPFIEFTGLMNEYLKCCAATLEAGRDFTQASAHAGGRLEMARHSVEYFAEKMNCILGPTLSEDPELATAFASVVTELPFRVPAPTAPVLQNNASPANAVCACSSCGWLFWHLDPSDGPCHCSGEIRRLPEGLSPERFEHHRAVDLALAQARAALESAERHGRRTDCLRDAVRSLEGALRCVAWENAEDPAEGSTP
jgi:hypothetical protein